MHEQNQWVHEVIEVLKEIGGKGTLLEIYEKIKERKKIDLSNYTDWKAQVRKNIYLYSSDTDIFKFSSGGEKDIFHSISGKGKGLWGLREQGGVNQNEDALSNSHKKKNPPWKRDELILALDLYFRKNPNHISNKHREVIKLSAILNSLPIHEEKLNAEKFRNPHGVYMKLCNFLRFDPDYPGKGLERGSKLEEKVWNEYYNDKAKLHNIAQSIIASVTNKEEASKSTKSEEEEEFPEGKVLYRVHKYRERNNNLVKKKKQVAKEADKLRCEVCNFDFYETYGELGEGFIECHHTLPVSEYKDGTKTKLDDLVLVCSNCHRMLHRRRPWLTKEQLQNLLLMD
ncbi:HNH endonuclease [Priestia megaterium]|uniref:HNH endonuclease n=1 Tax=Priestia megaterium TaxID=1404 RepID=UPI002E22DDFA|nr:HNH endonuclease [Priestia megaterium]MED3871980.1 HNH endonuclease [Priestia megaterium]